MMRTARHPRPSRGFSLLEATLMIVILSIVAVGVGVALQSITHVPEGADVRLSTHMRIVERMEQLYTLDFDTLYADIGKTTLNDSVTINGTTYPRTVTVVTCDGKGTGTPDPDFIQITVTVNGQSLITRRANPS